MLVAVPRRASRTTPTSHAGSTSSALTQTVTAGTVDTTTALTSSLNPSAYGQQVTFAATVSPSSGATGTVTFMDGGSTLGSSTLNASGVATFSASSLIAGTHSITARYGGDASHGGSTSLALSQTVNKSSTTTTLTSDPNPSKNGRSVTFTATISSATAKGTVQFLDGPDTTGNRRRHQWKRITVNVNTQSGDAFDDNRVGSSSTVVTQTVTGKK
jgi:hypothetical protein